MSFKLDTIKSGFSGDRYSIVNNLEHQHIVFVHKVYDIRSEIRRFLKRFKKNNDISEYDIVCVDTLNLLDSGGDMWNGISIYRTGCGKISLRLKVHFSESLQKNVIEDVENLGFKRVICV